MRQGISRFPSIRCFRCLGLTGDCGLIEALACHCFDRRRVDTLLRRVNPDDPILKEAREHGRERMGKKDQRLRSLKRELEGYEETLSYAIMDRILSGEPVDTLATDILEDRTRESLIKEIRELQWEGEEVLKRDVMEALAQHEKLGLVEVQDDDRITITSRGARILARKSLRRIFAALRSKGTEGTEGGKRGMGVRLSSSSRPYELGDEYARVDFEKTLLAGLVRNGHPQLRPEDFYVYEALEEPRVTVGLLIDESGSMAMDEKIRAAIETSLALSELISRETKGRLRVFLFSDRVREIPPWEIVNQFLTGRTTDTRAALIAFRKAVASEPSNKQAYLITDTSPNTQNGTFVGFERAMRGVMEEALRYRHDHITLNIVMLDTNPRLRAFAQALARNTLGRVFFARPDNLGEVVVEDYLRAEARR